VRCISGFQPGARVTAGVRKDILWVCKKQKENSVAWCERTVPTERQPLVGEVSANFYG
jgi:hypothetical protein